MLAFFKQRHSMYSQFVCFSLSFLLLVLAQSCIMDKKGFMLSLMVNYQLTLIMLGWQKKCTSKCFLYKYSLSITSNHICMLRDLYCYIIFTWWPRWTEIERKFDPHEYKWLRHSRNCHGAAHMQCHIAKSRLEGSDFSSLIYDFQNQVQQFW